MKCELETDLEQLRAEGCSVLSYTKTQNGYVILWRDDKGYTLTVREPKSSSVGCVLPALTAKTDYIRKILELL